MLLAVCWFVLVLFAGMETEACREGLAHGDHRAKELKLNSLASQHSVYGVPTMCHVES